MAAVLFVFSFMALALCRPSAARPGMILRDVHPTIPEGYSAGGNAPPSGSTLRLTLAMPHRNISGLSAALMDVSDPTSQNYGRHLSKADVQKFVAPAQDSVMAVTSWLNKNGISSKAASPAGDMLTLEVSVEQANTLLEANFMNYVHDKTNATMVRTLKHSLPASVHDHITYIYPTTQFIAPIKAGAPDQSPVKLPKRRRDPNSPHDPCDGVTTPQCLQTLYNIPSSPAIAPGNSIAVSSYGQNALTSDLESFLSQARPDIKNGTFTTVVVDGPAPPFVSNTVEASIDVQYTVGLATNVPATLIIHNISEDGIITADNFIDMANFLLEMETPPLVFSTSYGFDEYSGASFAQVAERLCNSYMQLGARGVSVINSAGDGGVAGSFLNSTDNCTGTAFTPTFPASCPYVTTVGSTQYQGRSEIAAPFSSGGFSNIFPRPSYQDTAVVTYLDALGDTYEGRYNAGGRAYPDVATLGTNFSIEFNGTALSARGTSTSAPTFASVVALLNDQLLGAGHAPLGFLNPMLYARGAAAMRDVTSGSNPGCGTDGFAARAGWDPVTGLGTPDFDKLVEAITGHPSTFNRTSVNGEMKSVVSRLWRAISLVSISLVIVGLW